MVISRRQLMGWGTIFGAWNVSQELPAFLSDANAQPSGDALTAVPPSGLSVRISSKAGVKNLPAMVPWDLGFSLTLHCRKTWHPPSGAQRSGWLHFWKAILCKAQS